MTPVLIVFIVEILKYMNKIRGNFIPKSPLDPFARAYKLSPNSSIVVVMMILITSRAVERGEPFKIKSYLCKKFGLSRQALARNIRVLEANGFITVKASPGKTPALTLLDSQFFEEIQNWLPKPGDRKYE